MIKACEDSNAAIIELRANGLTFLDCVLSGILSVLFVVIMHGSNPND